MTIPLETTMDNQQLLLDNRPQGEATVGNFKLVTAPHSCTRREPSFSASPLLELGPLYAWPYE